MEPEMGLSFLFSKAGLERCLFFSGLFVFPEFHHSLNCSYFSKWQQILRGLEGRKKGKTETWWFYLGHW